MKLNLAETPIPQGLAKLVPNIIETCPPLNCILQESRCLYGPEKLGTKQPLVVSLYPSVLMLLSNHPWVLVLCHLLSTAVLVGYRDVLHGDYFQWLMTQSSNKFSLCYLKFVYFFVFSLKTWAWTESRVGSWKWSTEQAIGAWFRFLMAGSTEIHWVQLAADDGLVSY